LGSETEERAAGPSPAARKGRRRRQDHITKALQIKEIEKIMVRVTHDDPARAARLARIQRAIADGTYDASSRAVADALIRHVLTDAVV
jgi:anti-sigma28 factor (negative regulator of flagellin synthesis)